MLDRPSRRLLRVFAAGVLVLLAYVAALAAAALLLVRDVGSSIVDADHGAQVVMAPAELGAP